MHNDDSNQKAPPPAPSGFGFPAEKPTGFVYARPTGQELYMDVTSPKGDGPFPALLLLHGGGWTSGSKLEMAEMARDAADHGFVAASADYRFTPRFQWPCQLEDARAAVRYLRAHARDLHVDPDKIAACGVSAGGHLSMFLGSTDEGHTIEISGFSSRVKVVGSISGIHDFSLLMTPQGETYQIIEKLVGERKGKNADQASPIKFLSKGSAPTYFIQGAQDPLVPANQSTVAVEKLKALGVPNHYELVPGMGHGLDMKTPKQKEAFQRMLAWIKKQLDG
jgi:acetyl esterase/lipase